MSWFDSLWNTLSGEDRKKFFKQVGDFNQDLEIIIGGMHNEINSLKQDVKSIESATKRTVNSIIGQDTQFQIEKFLNEKLSVEEKLEKYQKELNEYFSQIKFVVSSTGEVKKDIKNITDEIDKISGEIEKIGQDFNQLQSEKDKLETYFSNKIDDLSKGFTLLEGSILEINKTNDEFRKDLSFVEKRLNSETKDLKNSIQQLQEALEKTQSYLKFFLIGSVAALVVILVLIFLT